MFMFIKLWSSVVSHEQGVTWIESWNHDIQSLSKCLSEVGHGPSGRLCICNDWEHVIY